jgi:hypothetical protein
MSQSETPTSHRPTEHDVHVVIDDRPYVFETDDETGLEIKTTAGIPDNYNLYRREHGANEPISNDERIELKQGDHFFSRPPSNVS